MVQKSQATTVWMVLKPCKSWDKLPFPQLVGRISSINRRTLSVWSTNIKTLEVERLTPEKWMFFFVPADSGFLFGFRYILLGVNLLLNFQASQNYDPKIKISKCRSKYVKILYNYPVIYHALSIWNGACFPQQNLALIHPSLHHPKVPYNNSIIFMTKKNTSLGNQVLPTGVETPRVWKLTQGSTSPHIKTHTVTDLCGEVSNLPEVFFDWNSMELSLCWWWWVPGKIQACTHCTPSRTVTSIYTYIYTIYVYVCVNKLTIRNKSITYPGSLNQSMWKLFSKLPKLSCNFAPKRPFHDMFSLETHESVTSWHMKFIHFWRLQGLQWLVLKARFIPLPFTKWPLRLWTPHLVTLRRFAICRSSWRQVYWSSITAVLGWSPLTLPPIMMEVKSGFFQ